MSSYDAWRLMTPEEYAESFWPARRQSRPTDDDDDYDPREDEPEEDEPADEGATPLVPEATEPAEAWDDPRT